MTYEVASLHNLKQQVAIPKRKLTLATKKNANLENRCVRANSYLNIFTIQLKGPSFIINRAIMSVSRAAKNDAYFMKVQYKYAYYGRLLNNKTLNITFFVAVK